MKFLALLAMILSSSTWAHELELKNYVKMQEALAGDNFKEALSLHTTICKKELLHYDGEDYKDCKKDFKNIEELRESFKKLSAVYIENAKKSDMKGLMVTECPMAKAKWIQKEGKIANPYYGKSMLECGQKI